MHFEAFLPRTPAYFPVPSVMASTGAKLGVITSERAASRYLAYS
jgi:hypothetical protein